MDGGGLGRVFTWAALVLVCLVLVPFVLFSSLLGASSAATCDTAVASTPGDFSSLGDLSRDDPPDMPPLEIARRIYAVAIAVHMADDRRVLTAYAVALVESGGGVTMVNVRGGDADSTGVFQQRDIPPWNRRNRNNVSAAALSFFEALPGFDHGQSVGELAADIQRPLASLRYRYALAVPRARYFLERVKGGPAAPSEGLGSITATGTSCGGPVGPPGRGRVAANDDLVAPANAPARVVAVIEAANRIDDKPYIWGGGHGAWEDSGYDCSGAVSYALHGGGFLDHPMVAADFSSWGQPGPGRWITVYSSSIHVFMYVAGVRFDTSSYEPPPGSGDGPRWRTTDRPKAGFTVTHPGGY